MESESIRFFCFLFLQYLEINFRIIGSSRVGVSWARNRTFGGRNRGGRSAPFGSYRTRHKSRSVKKTHDSVLYP